MINKTKLVNTIEKYYLNGLTESVRLVIKDKILNIHFQTAKRGVVGNISAPIELEDAELGIYTTTSLLKLLNILDKDIQIQYESKHGVVDKLLIDDTQYKLIFSLSDFFVIEEVPNIIQTEYDLIYNIEEDFITRFVECKKALDVKDNRYYFEFVEDNKAKVVLGKKDDYSNKLEFNINVEYEGFPFDISYFDADPMREILVVNKNFDSAILKLNPKGLIYMKFIEGDITSEYGIIASIN